MILSVVIITHNEEANIGRTLASVQPLVAEGQGEIIVVDSESTDRTVEIAKSYGAKVFVEEWKGFAAQKNSAIDKAEGDWILSLDADEEVEHGLARAIHRTLTLHPELRRDGYCVRRKNFFLGRWIRHGGFWPDRKLRLFKCDTGKVEDRRVHETIYVDGHTEELWHITPILRGALIHHSYPTLTDYIDHMNRYSSLGAEMAVAKSPRGFSLFNIVVRPWATFTYNYIFRLGFLDGREGLLLHLYHAVYVSWKYAKAWELSRKK
jgi:glycosyltransferase involved in cell wall biosynthesis